jgi:hypothetical protein
MFLIRVQAFLDLLRGELPHVQIFMYYGPNTLTLDAQLLSFCFSRNPAVGLPTFSSVLSGVVTVLRPARRGASQVKNHRV